MNSLAARIGWSAALLLTIFVALTVLALERAFADSAGAAMRERLFARLYLVMAATEVEPGGLVQLPPTLGEPRLNLPDSGLYARIDRPGGAPAWRSPSALGVPLPEPVEAPGERFGRVALAGEDYFVAALRIDWETADGSVPLIYSVIEHPAAYAEQMARYRHSLWGALGVMALLLLLTLTATLAWGLRPLRQVATELRAIESGDQPMLCGAYPREISRLSDNINTLLHHERAQQARYRNALADLAHSLKTPLAVLRGMEWVGEDSQTLEEQVARMDNIVQYQLQRAATAGRSTLAGPLAVAPVAERLLASLQKVYRDKGLRLERTLDPQAAFRGDEGDLMELLGNLLDNACKWAAHGVWLTASREGRTLLLGVEDDGPGIEPGQAGRVLGRGVRLDENTPGHGIGLPMVRDIVEAYDGHLEIGRSGHGGARILISLPL
jgi:two-component system sensor histidine kinase PhoQ